MERNHPPDPRIRTHLKPIRRGRWLGTALVILLVLSGGVATALYLARERLAALVAQNYLAQYGIPSTIEFRTLGWDGFVARVRAGSPDAPEFTAAGVQVTLSYPGGGVAGSVTPVVTRIRLIQPTLDASFDGTKLFFGALQLLVDDLLAGPATSPKPDIVVENGTLRLATPNGPVALIANAVIANGTIRNLKANVLPAMLRGKDFAAQLTGGSVVADGAGDMLNVRLALNVAAVSLLGSSAKNLDVQTHGEIGWKADGDAYNVAIAVLNGAVRSERWDAAFGGADRSTAEFALQDIAATLKGGELHATGRGEVRSHSAGFHLLDVEAADLASNESFSALAMDVSPSGWNIAADVHTAAEGSGVVYPIRRDRVSLASAQGELDGSVA